ncbi:MAG: hypothetical protein ACJZ62_05425 [Candidatus Pelagibacterales bacterium]
MTNNPIFCAIDTSDIDNAIALVDQISPHIGGIKLGLEFFYVMWSLRPGKN